jgi:large subunit ribosomal protein L10
MRHDKQLLLDEVKGQIDDSGTFVIMSYSKLTANAANSFRRGVQKLGGGVEVVRKRVLIKAAESAGVKLDLSDMPGHIGLVFARQADPVTVTKYVFDFGKSEGDAIAVVGGRFEGKLYSGADVEKLSKLPGKDEMRAQFLSVLEAPMSQTLAVMEALLSSVVYCLDNKVKLENPENKE